MNEHRFLAMTEGELRDGMTDSVASLSYRIACENELKRRGLRTRNDSGQPIGRL